MDLQSIEQFNDETTMEKYELASEIANEAMDILVDKIGNGKRVKVLVEESDQWILSKIKEKKYKGGLAFPTCISINQQAGYFRPKKDEDMIIRNGNLAKIELGVHIDGFPAVIGFTKLVLEEGKKLNKEDKRSRVVQACADASRGVLEVVNFEKSNIDVVKVLEVMADKYNVNLLWGDMELIHLPGTMSFQMSRNVLDSKNDEDEVNDIHKMILNRHHPSYDFSMVETFFEGNEVYMIDVAYSSGEGKIKLADKVTTIFKRTENYKALRSTSAKKVLSELRSKFPMDCSKYFETPKGKIGLTEIFKNKLIEGYPLMEEHRGEYIGRTIFTVIIQRPNKNDENEGHILLTGKSASSELEKIDMETVNNNDK